MDIRIVFDEALLAGDLAVDGAGGLATDDSLRTAIIVSLFTDARAEVGDELPPGEARRRGWWGDGAAEVAGDRIGSRLWLLAREKHTEAVRAKAEEYAAAALAWLVEDRIAARVDVAAEWIRTGVLGLQIVVHRPSGAAETYRFDHVWEAV